MPNPTESETYNWWFRGQRRTRPDTDIAVVWDDHSNRYQALEEPNEIWAQIAAEGVTEEVCHYNALWELFNGAMLVKFPVVTDLENRLAMSVIMFEGGFSHPFARCAFCHDLEDCILALDLPGALLS